MDINENRSLKAANDGADHAASDEGVLGQLGHKQELKRHHTFWTLMAYQTTTLCSWGCNIVMYPYIFTLGGPVCFVWGTAVTTLTQMSVMASLAEYCSLWPTAGGQQFFIQMVASDRYYRFLSYVIGWCVLWGQISTVAGSSLNSAQVISAFVQITHPEIEWKDWMTYLLYVALAILVFILNLVPKWLPTLSVTSCIFNILNCMVWAVVFLCMADKNGPKFTFTQFVNSTGWTSTGWVCMLSLYIPYYGLYGTEAVMHLVEEMKNPSRHAPRVMVWSMGIAGIIGWLSAIILCFTAGPNWAVHLESPSSYMAWFMDVLDSTYGGGTWCAILLIGLNTLIATNLLTACSRLSWSMARDKAFPESNYLSHVHKGLGLPLRTMTVVIIIVILIGLLYLGSSLAFYAIVSATGVSFQTSYAVPILCVVIRGRQTLPARPNFDLGRWGYTINIIALIWSVVVLVVLIFPQMGPVSGSVDLMNWSPAILAAVILFAGVYWVIQGKHQYLIGTNTVLEDNVVIIDGVSRVFTRTDEEPARQTGKEF